MRKNIVNLSCFMVLGIFEGPLGCGLSWRATSWFNIRAVERNGLARERPVDRFQVFWSSMPSLHCISKIQNFSHWVCTLYIGLYFVGVVDSYLWKTYCSLQRPFRYVLILLVLFSLSKAQKRMWIKNLYPHRRSICYCFLFSSHFIGLMFSRISFIFQQPTLN